MYLVGIDVPQGTDHHHTVSTGDPVDAIHEIVGIQYPGAKDQGYQREVPGHIKQTPLMEHQGHSQKLYRQSKLS